MWRKNTRFLRVSTQVLAWAAICSVGLSACESIKNPFPRKSSKPPAELGPAGPAPAPPTPAPVTGAPVQQGLTLSSQQRFPDIPLPQGVKEVPDKSFVYEDKALQFGRMVYKTRSTVNDLANFYIRECPAAEWKNQNVVQADGVELLFTKPGKRLSVVVRNHGPAVGRELTLTVTPESSK